MKHNLTVLSIISALSACAGDIGTPQNNTPVAGSGAVAQNTVTAPNTKSENEASALYTINTWNQDRTDQYYNAGDSWQKAGLMCYAQMYFTYWTMSGSSCQGAPGDQYASVCVFHNSEWVIYSNFEKQDGMYTYYSLERYRATDGGGYINLGVIIIPNSEVALSANQQACLSISGVPGSCVDYCTYNGSTMSLYGYIYPQ